MVLSHIVAYGRRFQGAGHWREETEMRSNRKTGARPTRPESVIGASGLILLVLSFVPWWGTITTGSLRLGESGRLPSAVGRFNAHFGYGWTLELAIVLGAVATILAIGRRILPLRLPRWLYFLLGLAMTSLVIASIMRGPVESGFVGVAGIEVSRGPFLFGALVPCVLIALAGLGFGRSQRLKRRS
jgi:hypothetical protein